MNQDKSKKQKCFVCRQYFQNQDLVVNKRTMLPVCKKCKGTDAEKKAEKEALDSLAEDFVCGCI